MSKLFGLTLRLTDLCSHQSFIEARGLHLSAIVHTSVFIKKQKKMDPEVAKIRETRRRRKLEKEIRQLKKHGRTPKPVEEMQLDIKSAKNVKDRLRPPIPIEEDELDRRFIALKNYCISRSALMKKDDEWIRRSIKLQEKALNELKNISPKLYDAAIQADTSFDEGITLYGPTLTPPLPEYESPDGDYIDTTRSWI